MNTIKFNLQAVASGVAALALVTLLSVTFVDATSFANVQHYGGSAILSAISSLVG